MSMWVWVGRWGQMGKWVGSGGFVSLGGWVAGQVQVDFLFVFGSDGYVG